MSDQELPPLRHAIRDLEALSRLQRIDLIEVYPDAEQRISEARLMLRQLLMHQVFDQFTAQQQGAIVDRLWPLAYSDDDVPRPDIYGGGTRTQIPTESQ